MSESKDQFFRPQDASVEGSILSEHGKDVLRKQPNSGEVLDGIVFELVKSMRGGLKLRYRTPVSGGARYSLILDRPDDVDPKSLAQIACKVEIIKPLGNQKDFKRGELPKYLCKLVP